MKYITSLFIALFISISLFADLRGTVVDENGEPIIGAELVWLNTVTGGVTDVNGNFHIRTVEGNNLLRVYYISYQTDTIAVTDTAAPLNIVMREESIAIKDVTVSGRAAATITSRISPLQTQKITGAELCKAACCNLSESFETNASVDVAYADAATGAKQIRLLGLAGTYVQLLTENTPGIRGLAQNYGMEYIPGAWMESIQVSKGTSSVINGYEATTGQINVEYLKPNTQDPIALNGMFSSSLRGELNATGGWDINPYVSTGVLAHYKTEQWGHDGNGDGFMDIPKSQQANVLNRWYIKRGDYTGQVLVRGLYDERIGGQFPSAAKGYDPYSIGIYTWRADAFVKNGYVFDPERGTSLGVIVSGSYHNQDAVYGRRFYDGAQGNLYANAIFQTNFTDEHKLVAGASVNFDHYTERLDFRDDVSMGDGSMNFDRQEVTPGVFAEYSFNYRESLSLLLGLRGDWSSRYGFFVTPRFNVRYSPWQWWNIRGSVGLGYRSPNLLSDNAFVMPTSRRIVVTEELAQERALNAGVSTTFYIPISGRELQISAEYYYTNFFESVVVDMDSDPHAIIFSNLDGGRAYAGNAQIEATMEVLKGWTMTLAYRYTDVRTTIGGRLVEKPLTNRFKGLITTSYVTPLKRWQFDLTAQFNGGGRMPVPDAANPLWDSEFPWYPQLMAQVTRYFRTWSIYLGAENITNFTQSNPVISAANPWSGDFDASMAWGPIHGAKVYIGFRWALDRAE